MEQTLNSFEFVDLFWKGKSGYVFVPRLTKEGGWIEGTPKFYAKSMNDDVKEYIEYCLDLEENIYFAPMIFKNQKRMNKYALSHEWLWADTDDGTVDLPCPPTLVVQSSENSYQSYWKLDKKISPEKHNALNRIVNWSQEADRNGWGLTKVLRLVGSHNYKKNRKKFEVKVSEFNDKVYSSEEMLDYALKTFRIDWVKNYGKGKFINNIEMFGKEWEKYEKQHTV